MAGIPKSRSNGLTFENKRADELEGEKKCDCEGGVVQELTTWVFCVDCVTWHHVTCQLGKSTQFGKKQAELGFICRACRTVNRSANARKGYHARLQNSGAGKKSSASSIKRRHSAFDDSVGGKRKTAPRKATMAPRKSAPSSSDPVEAEDEDDDDNDEIVVSSPAIKQETSGRRRSSRHIMTKLEELAAKIGDPLEEWRKGINSPPEVLCDCEGSPAGKLSGYMTCARCARLQHEHCMPVKKDDPIGEGLLCIECLGARKEDAARIEREKDRLIRQKLTRLHKEWEEAIATRRTSLRNTVANRFWIEYCNLPNSQQANNAVKELTATYYDEAVSKLLPTHPAPAAWVDRVVDDIYRLISKENKQLVKQVHGRDTRAFHSTEPEHFRRSLNALAVLTVHHGLYEGSNEKLGLLAEVLGLEEKGSVWKV
ncbi:hypothetical protein LTR78_004427 [Recurvomyces mirabilis]|uniref:Zinc finger PHD-type domain-containing protein n=1 Tax=Recurvomyces mirabilis TaxID=574656 RepID=A0AAE0WPV5_9PEZI|nr:hypothetical protein LTR78_004427 [Recurvomyces mirabilis]KAK5155907.1 hypothetical protein LTS14_005473 [Recurvomyces mirabilis]